MIFQYGEYNIIEYDRVYYGIPLATGELNLVEADLAKVPGVISADLIRDVISEIDRLSADDGEE